MLHLRSLLRAVVLSIMVIMIVGSLAMAQTKISLLTHGGLTYRSTMEGLVEEFNASHPDIEVELLFGDNDANVREKFLVSSAGGTAPNVVWHYETPLFASKGLVKNLESYIARDSKAAERELLESASWRHRYTGKLYAMPHGNNVNIAVFYNRHLLERAGLSEPQAGWTWDDFLQYARGLTKDSDGDNEVDQWGWGLWNWYAFPWVASAGGRLFDEKAENGRYWLPDSDETLEALHFMTQLIQTQQVQPVTGGGNDSFADSTLGMMGNGSYNLPYLRQNAPDLDFGIVSWPVKRNRHIFVGGYALYMADTGTAATQEASWKFIEWMTQPEQEIRWGLGTGQVPSHLDTLQSASYQEEVRREEPLLLPFVDEAVQFGQAFPLMMGFGDVWGKTIDRLGAMALGEVAPNVAYEQLMNDARVIFAEIEVPIK